MTRKVARSCRKAAASATIAKRLRRLQATPGTAPRRAGRERARGKPGTGMAADIRGHGTETPDVVLSALRMPQVDGIEPVASSCGPGGAGSRWRPAAGRPIVPERFPGAPRARRPDKERSRFLLGSATRASASTWRRAVPKRRCVGWRRAATSSRAGRRGRSWPAAPTASSESPAPGPGPLRGAFARSYPGAAWSATSRTVRTEEEYFLTQYVLAPLLLDRGGAHAVVVGNFFDPARAPAIAARIGLVLLADRGDETETAQGPGPLRRRHTVRSGALTSGGSCAGRRSRRSERPRPSPAPWPR